MRLFWLFVVLFVLALVFNYRKCDESEITGVEYVVNKVISKPVNGCEESKQLFFKTSTKRLDFDFGKYKYLLIDAHKAPQVDTMASLVNDFDVPPENIASVCAVNYCHHMDNFKNKFAKFKLSRTFERNFQNSFVRKSYLNRNVKPLSSEWYKYIDDTFDVIVCTFPTWHCKPFIDMGKVVVVRFSHTPFHSMDKMKQKNWILDLVSNRNKLVVSSNNPYHHTMFKHMSGQYPLPWASTYQHARESGTYSPDSSNMVVDIGSSYTQEAKDAFESMPKNGTDWTFVDFKRLVKPDDIRHKATMGVVFPYALHTAKITEFYSIGTPLLLPSIEHMVNLSKHFNVLPHREGPPVGVMNGFCFHDLFVTGVGVVDRNIYSESIRFWLQFSEFWLWPHLYYYDSFDEIPDLVSMIVENEVERKSRSKKMIEFFDDISKNGRFDIKEKLSHALQQA